MCVEYFSCLIVSIQFCRHSVHVVNFQMLGLGSLAKRLIVKIYVNYGNREKTEGIFFRESAKLRLWPKTLELATSTNTCCPKY